MQLPTASSSSSGALTSLHAGSQRCEALTGRWSRAGAQSILQPSKVGSHQSFLQGPRSLGRGSRWGNFEIWPPWPRPEIRSNFSPRIFWKLSSSESESTYQTVVLDKRKLQTIHRIKSRAQKTDQNLHTVTALHFQKFAPALKSYYLDSAGQSLPTILS